MAKATRAQVEALAQVLFESRADRKPRGKESWKAITAPVLDGRDGAWKGKSIAAFYRGLARTAYAFIEHHPIESDA